MSGKAISISWYRPEDYDRVLMIMSDSDGFPPTFDKWLVGAETGKQLLEAKGEIVIRAFIDPDDFFAWCFRNGRILDGNARIAYTDEKITAVIKARQIETPKKD